MRRPFHPGDDEQSDFFHEAGPACGIPAGVMAWWDEEGPLAQLGAHFQAILGASLAPHMPHPHRLVRLCLNSCFSPQPHV
ncbi:hypothetical protein IscW_ISCW007620 [Ixodes scapularis]|uniref:Uncharacterized protein n=1 Tax=Ixodes scapularis TaxID=6945 RepID=B7PRG8_IXOSC|nr:hypothetical protein IscW_ISCW007620 [Ixodes scapularis]|eukprot:XP_002399647.1 hypothetical protein IscW_ISCW007620 [Ixodes scapularis]